MSIHSQFVMSIPYFVLQMIINMKECRVQSITHGAKAPDPEPDEEEDEEEEEEEH